MIQSGVRPYVYSRDPFVIATGEKVGLSGVFFEEPMFAIIAERDIYTGVTGNNRKFTKYINKGALVTGLFEPDTQGRNLTGSLTSAETPLVGVYAGPACANFVDYIQDLRDAVSGLCMTYISTDSDYSGVQIMADYMTNHVGSPNWTHPNPASLSGGIYDKDLDEVLYNPYPRVSKFRFSTTNSFGPNKLSPIFPCFMSTNGTMVNVGTRDLAHAYNITGQPTGTNIVGSGYAAANTGRFLVLGDGFAVTTSQLRIGYDLLDVFKLKSSAAGTCQAVYGRILNKALPAGLGEFTAPVVSLTSGLYGFQVYDTSADIGSGLIGIWPVFSEYERYGLGSSGFVRNGINGDYLRASGIHIFDNGFWSVNASGTSLDSPINGERLWTRFADQTSFQTANMASAKRFLDCTPSYDPDTESNLIWSAVRSVGNGGAPQFFTEYMTVARWNKNSLDFVDATEWFGTANYTTDPISVTIICNSLASHAPSSGVNLSSYQIINAREGSDSFLRSVVWNGTNGVGTIQAFNSTFTAANEPEYIGCINGHIYGRSPTATDFILYHYEFQIETSFPRISASGMQYSLSPWIQSSRSLIFDNNIAPIFEQQSSTTFSLPWPPKIIQPQGALDNGDGSVFIGFSAKRRGSTVLDTWVGRVNEVTSGVTPQLQISQIFGPFTDTPHYVSDFTT